MIVRRTQRECTFSPCSLFDFESVVTAQNDEFKGSFESLYSHSLNATTYSQETQYFIGSILSIIDSIEPITFVKCIFGNISCALGKWCLHSRWNFISAFTELHVHGDERWPIELVSNSISTVLIRRVWAFALTPIHSYVQMCHGWFHIPHTLVPTSMYCRFHFHSHKEAPPMVTPS